MKNPLYFNIDVPAFLNELQANSTPNQGYVMTIPMAILKTKLAQIAQIATRLNDPELNILKLETKLFEVNHKEVSKLIEEQRQRLTP